MADTPVTILRRPQVEARTGLSRSTIYERIARGEFPRPVKIGARAVGWPSNSIDAFIAECIRRAESAS